MNLENNRAGFTLIEIVVMIAILGVMGVVTSNIFFTSLKSSVKSQTNVQLKQKGNNALSVMERMIRQSIIESNCDGASHSSIEILYNDDLTTFSCSSDQIASNSANSTTLVSDVTSIDCSDFITCTLNGATPEVIIKFTLNQGESGTGALPYRGSADFESKIIPRNY